LRAAGLIERAVNKIMTERKTLTGDLGGTAKTSEMGDAIAAAILQSAE
jgi:isocitrate/isopropylmalate dehydrogenase